MARSGQFCSLRNFGWHSKSTSVTALGGAPLLQWTDWLLAWISFSTVTKLRERVGETEFWNYCLACVVLFKACQNSISIFLKKIKFLTSHAIASTREDLSIDVSITNVGLILTKLWWFLFSGYGRTDRHGFGILTWKHVGTQKISTQSSKLGVSCRSLYASPEDGDA